MALNDTTPSTVTDDFTYNLTTENSTADYYDYYGMEFASDISQLISAVAFFPLGLLGNLMTIIILTRRKNRNSATAVMIIVLAFSDSMILLTGSFVFWLGHELDFMSVINNEVGCKLIQYLNLSCVQTSSWILACISIERACLVIIPLRARSIFTTKSSVIISSLIVISMLCFNIPVTIGSVKRPEDDICTYTDAMMPYFLNVFPLIDFSLSFFIPFTILVATSCIIIVGLRLKMKGKQASAVLTSVTITMLLVNVAFIVTLMPFCVYRIITPYGFDIAIKRMPEIWYFFIQLSELNPVINFPLYCLANRRFRDEVKVLLTRCRTTVESSEGVFGGKLTS